MKLLSVMAGFFPGKKYGGPPVSMNNFCTLMNEIDCYIVCRDHDMGENDRYSDIQEGWNERPNCKVQYLRNDKYNEYGFEKIILDLNPDVLYLQGLFQSCVFPCLKLAKKYNINVLLAPRGELCAGAFRKKYKKIPYIEALKVFGMLNKVHFQSTSEEETVAIQKWLGISATRIHFLTNIPSIPMRKYQHLKKEPGSAKLIFLSRIIWKKNLLFALECLEKVKGNVQFDIYGPIEDQEYWEKCQREINSLPCNIQVNYCGVMGHEKVHEIFARYDAFFFPTLSENFGHVIAEALSVGCPVIISNQTPFSDAEQYLAGWVVTLENKSGFTQAVNCILAAANDDMEQLRKSTTSYFENKLVISSIKKAYELALLQVIKC